MRSLEGRTAWTAVRTALLVAAGIHVLILPRSAQFGPFSLGSLLGRSPDQVLKWLGWSLVAPGIGLPARHFATKRLRWCQTLGLLLCGGVVSMSLYYVLEELLEVAFRGRPFFESVSETGTNLLWGWDLPIFGLILSTCLALEYYRHNRQKEVLASRLE